jgi:glycosyltransferase involved in cell wall biosynthesis
MGGSEYQIKCLLESNLLQDLFDIFVLCKRIGIGYRAVGYKVVQIVKPFTLQRYAHFVDAPFLLRKLKEISPDVIYQNIGTSYAGIASFFARKEGCKMVLHIASDNSIVPYEGNLGVKSLGPYIEKKSFDYAVYNTTKLIAQTNIQKQLIREHYSRSVDAVIYNFQPYPKEKIDKRMPIKVVWVANFKYLKQPEIFIRLAKDISKKTSDTEFLMVGRPCADIRWQKSLEKDIGQIPSLRYLGEKNNDEINEILAKSHIFVNTSRYEGFSNTFIQAWMRGVPVVSLNSNPDNLLNGLKIGFSSEGSYIKLCNDVLLLIKCERLRKKIGENAKEFSLERFTMANAEDIMSILKS